MTPRSRAGPPALLAGFLILGLGLQGCVATAVTGATFGVAKAAVHTATKVATGAVGTAGKVAGATVHAAGRPFRRPPPSQ
jgi:hydroxyethylthiazole kinase-like sugar kinase family protein